MMDCLGFSEAGRKGPNQDFILSNPFMDGGLFIVADGMGGGQAGDAASRIAVEVFSGFLLKSQDENVDFSLAIGLAKKAIEEYAEKNNIEKMGTTITSVLVHGKSACVAHVGDCRLYHLRGDGILTVTKDQTEVQKLIDDGVLSKKRAEKYRRRNVLLSAVTNYSNFEVFEKEIDVEKGDRLILVSDGFYRVVKKSEIRDLSVNSDSISELTRRAKELVKSKEIIDDYSFLAFEIS